jgi:small subunit ribosomal protein S7
MPRRSGVPKRDVLPDSKYGSKIITKLINQIMEDGKKQTAENIVYGAFTTIEEKLNQKPNEVFTKAMENVMPLLETKSRRVGGSNYQVPMEVAPARRQTLAIRWIVLFARKRSERTMQAKLAAELMDAFNGAGGSVKRKDEMHRMAEANKAFAHYRW